MHIIVIMASVSVTRSSREQAGTIIGIAASSGRALQFVLYYYVVLVL